MNIAKLATFLVRALWLLARIPWEMVALAKHDEEMAARFRAVFGDGG